MPIPGAAKIAECILAGTAPFVDVPSRLVEILRESDPELGDLVAVELEDRLLPAVRAALTKRIDSSKDKFVIPSYDWSSTDPQNRLVRAGVMGGTSGDAIVVAHRAALIKALGSISWRDFEYLARHLIEVNGIIGAHVGPGTKEDGIDFYGYLDMNTVARGTLLKGLRLRVVGQARYWENPVGQGEMEKFVRQCEKFAKGEGAGAVKLPEAFVKNPWPVLPVYLSLAGFTAGAVEEAGLAGVVLREAEHIAEDLLRCEGTAWLSSTEGQASQFDEAAFLSFVKSLRNE